MKQTLPYSEEAERAVIGALLLDNSKLEQVSIIISKQDFFIPKLSIIFGVIRELHIAGIPVDPVTVISYIQKNKIMGKGFEADIYGLAIEVPSTSNIEAYACIVRERSVLRQLIKLSEEMIDEIKNPLLPLDVKDMLTKVELKVKNLIEVQAKA